MRRHAALLVATTALCVVHHSAAKDGDGDEDNAATDYAAIKELFDAHCKSAGTICVFVDKSKEKKLTKTYGAGDKKLESQTLQSVSVGTVLTVRIILPKGTEPPGIRFTENSASDTVFPAASKTVKADGMVAGTRWEITKETTHTVTAAATSVEIHVGAGDGRVHYEFPVERGRYYVEAGFLTSLIVDGKREIRQVQLPDGSGSVYSLESSTRPATGFAVTAFPFGGRRKGNVFYWRGGGRVSDRLGEMIGLQGAVAFSLSDPLERVHLGVVLEPIAGLGFGAGVAFVKTKAFATGYSNGMLVVDPAADPSRDVYRPRFYVGLTLTLDVLQTLGTAFTAIGNARPTGS